MAELSHGRGGGLPWSSAPLAAAPRLTERLLLRPILPGDADDVWAYQSDPEVLRYIPWPERTREEARAHTETRAGFTALAADGDAAPLAVVLADGPDAGRVIGDVMLRLGSVEHATIEVGWAFATAFQGRGYASEACRALVDLAFAELGAQRVLAYVDTRNAASGALCERLGLRHQGTCFEDDLMDGAWADTWVFGQGRADWERGSPAAPGPAPVPPAVRSAAPAGPLLPGLPFDAAALAGEPLRTDRLRLRPIAEADTADVWLSHRDPEVGRYLPWPVRTEAESAADTRKRAALTRLDASGEHNVIFPAAEIAAGPDAGRVAGDIMLRLEDAANGCLEIGWVFATAFQGRGYATEAAGAVLALAFERLGAHRVVAVLDARNAASVALCGRLGLRFELLAPADWWDAGEWTDTASYAITAAEWAARGAGTPPAPVSSTG